MICTWTRPSWQPSTWTSTRSASGLSSTPATPTGTAKSPRPSGACASGGRVSILRRDGRHVRTHCHVPVCWHIPLATCSQASRCSTVRWPVTVCLPAHSPVPLRVKRPLQDTKNIPAACWQPGSPAALEDGPCQPGSQAETSSRCQTGPCLGGNWF